VSRYKKINTHQFKKENPELYAEIKESYAPIFDMWLAIAMYLNGDPPPVCKICNKRVRVAAKTIDNPVHFQCRYNESRISYKEAKSKIPDLVSTWEGLKKNNDKITRKCNTHGLWEQTLSSALNGHGCQKCYTQSPKTKKYTTQEWINLATKVHGDKYDYSKTVYQGIDNKVAILCKKHGEFKQSPNVHLNGSGCPQCAWDEASERGNKFTKEEFVNRANIVHNYKYNYGKTIYTGMNINRGDEKIIITCPKHGDFSQRPGDHIYNQNGCPKCGFDVISTSSRSEGEKALAEFLKNELGLNVVTNYRDLGFELDILLPDHNIAIEYNGLYWHSELSSGKGKRYHFNKWKTCQKNNIDLYTVYDCDYSNPAKRNIIHNKFRYLSNNHKLPVVGARCCTVDEVNVADEFALLEKYHIQGKLSSRSGSLGGYHKDQLVAVINWTIRRNYLEITRYACDCKASYPGLFSKMLKAVIKKTGYEGDIVSFSNNDHSNGNVYKQAGFELEKVLGPAYWYTKYKTRENRQKYMKDKIAKRFGIDMTDKTEWQAMQELGFDRIWDTGKIKWRLVNANSKFAD